MKRTGNMNGIFFIIRKIVNNYFTLHLILFLVNGAIFRGSKFTHAFCTPSAHTIHPNLRTDLSRYTNEGIGLFMNRTLQRSRTRLLESENNYEGDNTQKTNKDRMSSLNGSKTDHLDPIVLLPLATVAGIVILGLGVLYTKMTNPTVDFDIDFYMAIEDSTKVNDALSADTIVGLPQLSPAEQLVGALFGPPTSR